ncbi:MAG: hypothetical protein M1832_002989 [Thelocarpon impressellum]|nr:MAG: hypothetical protein M1832_002989 [Thelocarpon impressellum]
MTIDAETGFYTDSRSTLDLTGHAADGSSGTLNGDEWLGRGPLPVRPQTWRAKWERFWSRNKGVLLVCISQFFGSVMNVTTRLLETDGDGMHPLQVLFARMTITVVLCCLYMWCAKVPHFPFGQKEVRGLLICRGIGGFFGVFGLYYSLLYLPIAEATVLTFLAPILACWACSYILKETFSRKEQIAGLVSLLGVVLIARPFSISAGSDAAAAMASGSSDGGVPFSNGTIPAAVGAHGATSPVTAVQRLSAIGAAMLGVIGAACAYTTIRMIGKRAHPLISVNYFATWCSIVSTISLLVIPSISFQLPRNTTQWLYLVFLGISGFVMQFLLTAGLAHERSSRATNMVYTQMLFALGFDRLIWGTTPVVVSVVGGTLILGAALYVAMQRDTGAAKEGSAEEAKALVAKDEERALAEDVGHNHEAEECEDLPHVQLRPVRR